MNARQDRDLGGFNQLTQLHSGSCHDVGSMLILLRAARPLPAWPMIMLLPHMIVVDDINKAVTQMPKTAGHQIWAKLFFEALRLWG